MSGNENSHISDSPQNNQNAESPTNFTNDQDASINNTVNNNNEPENTNQGLDSGKKKRVTFDSTCSQNDNLNDKSKLSELTISKIKQFRGRFKTQEYQIFVRKDEFYDEVGQENCFTIFDRTFKSSIQLSTPDNKQVISRTKSTILKPLIEPSRKAIERAKSQAYIQDQDSDRLSQLRKLYITHFYKTIPNLFEYQYLANQINFFSKLNDFTLANFYCFSMTNSEGIFIPTVLTQRPVNGPLLNFFESSKKKCQQPCNDKIGTNNFDPFNIGLIEVNYERKFIFIAGITRAIYFIHRRNFIHSNLNPMTVYIDENHRPRVCDYVFVPPFHITCHTSKDYSDRIVYKYNYSIRKDQFNLDLFDNPLYVAPEIKNFEENKNENEFGPSIDIYSLGLIIYFILTEKEATFDETGNIEYPSNFSEKWKELIEKCINKDPSKRPSAEEILNNYILNETERELLITSISDDSKSSKKSDEILRYLALFNPNTEPFSIFADCIPNINDLDDETIKLIQAAEKEEIDSLIKVGDYFYEGSHNLYKDDVWAKNCYERAESKMKEEDERRQNVINKINQIDIKLQTLTLRIKDDKITKENIKEKLNITAETKDIIESQIQENREISIVFNDIDSVNSALTKITKSKAIRNIIDYNELIRKRNRFDSLSQKIIKIKPGEYYLDNPIENFIRDVIKGGVRSQCYKIFKKEDNKPYFAKVYTISKFDYHSINLFKREATITSELNHPAIIKYVGYCEFNIASRNPFKKSSNHLYLSLVQEYFPNGDLDDMINNPADEWNETNKLKVIIGIASAMNYLYEKNIIHRDLKPENIILNENFEPTICDFEYARHFNSKYIPMTTAIGTPVHEAPELLASCTFYKSVVDSYSFGVILYQILSDTPTKDVYTFDGVNEKKIMSVFKEIKNSNEYMLDKVAELEVSPVLADIIKSCWNVEFDGRLEPPAIYKKLIDAVLNGEVLIEGANMIDVMDYIERLENQIE